jgi:hypothetical protein
VGVEPDFNHPQMSPVTPPPQGAPPGWRPLSGLALTAFIVSLLLGTAAFFSGAWWLAAVAALLAVAGILRAVPARFRGRGFAITGLVISLTFGSCAYLAQATFRATATRLSTGVMRVLNADVAEDVRTERLRDWLHPTAIDAGAIETLRARWADLVSKMGPYTGEVEAGSTLGGHISILVGPQDGALVESDDSSRGLPDMATSAGKIFWTRATFEKGVVHVAVFLEGEVGKDLSAALSREEAAVLRDVRFYIPANVK